MNRTRALHGLLAALLVLPAVSGCGTSVEPDKAGLEYDAGPMSSTTFDQCVPQGTREWSGPGDKVFTYPAGQRSYEFSEDKDAESKPLSVVSKDELPMTVSGVATFSLATACGTLQKFHEAIGLKYKAYEDDGWLRMLGVYLRQPLDRAMDEAAKKHEWKDLYSNPDTKREWEQQVGAQVVEQVNQLAGGTFFCSPAYTGKGDCGQFELTLQQPQPPEKVQDALASAQEAREQAVAQENRNKQVDAEMESIRQLVKVLGPSGYVTWQAIKDGRIKVVPVPVGGSINVTGD